MREGRGSDEVSKPRVPTPRWAPPPRRRPRRVEGSKGKKRFSFFFAASPIISKLAFGGRGWAVNSLAQGSWKPSPACLLVPRAHPSVPSGVQLPPAARQHLLHTIAQEHSQHFYLPASPWRSWCTARNGSWVTQLRCRFGKSWFIFPNETLLLPKGKRFFIVVSETISSRAWQWTSLLAMFKFRALLAVFDFSRRLTFPSAAATSPPQLAAAPWATSPRPATPLPAGPRARGRGAMRADSCWRTGPPPQSMSADIPDAAHQRVEPPAREETSLLFLWYGECGLFCHHTFLTPLSEWKKNSWERCRHFGKVVLWLLQRGSLYARLLKITHEPKVPGLPIFALRAGSNGGISGAEAVGESIDSHETWCKLSGDLRKKWEELSCWNIPSGSICLCSLQDWMTCKGPFRPRTFCDSVKSSPPLKAGLHAWRCSWWKGRLGRTRNAFSAAPHVGWKRSGSCSEM